MTTLLTHDLLLNVTNICFYLLVDYPDPCEELECEESECLIYPDNSGNLLATCCSDPNCAGKQPGIVLILVINH